MDAAAEIKPMSGVERAAVLMMLVGEEEAAAILQKLEPDEVRQLGTAMFAVADVAEPQVAGVLDDFVAKAGAEKEKRLTRVFAGVFEVINGERNKVVAGIGRYAQGQRRMAERIREEADQISATKDAPSAQDARDIPKDASELETKFTWDRRIFQERSQSLTYVCEVPTLLEQRLGEIARRIQARL